MLHFDIAKGIGIILVIIGHTVGGLVHKFIFSFHMPLFFLIGGYFFHERDQRQLISKNFRRLLVPYIFTCIVVIALAVLKSVLSHQYSEIPNQLRLWTYASLYGSGVTYRSPFYIKQIGAVWFLLALFVAGYCFNMVLKYQHRFLWVALFVYVGFETSKFIWLPFSIQAGLVGTAFLYTGYVVKEYKVLEKKIPLPFQISMFALWIFCIIYGGLSMVDNYYKNGLLDALGAVSATYFVIKLAKLIENNAKLVSKWLIVVGQNTLVVLCFHLIELNMFPWAKVISLAMKYGIDRSKSVLIILALRFVWAIFGILLVKKVPILRKIFFPSNIKGRGVVA